MMSQIGKQIIIIDILPNISRIKGNKTMKFRHLVEYNLRFSFSQDIMRKMRSLFVQKKRSVKHLSFNIFW